MCGEPKARAVRACLALALVAGAARAEGRSPEQEFTLAENTFRFQDYAKAEKLLNGLLHPEVRLKSRDMVIKAREYLGACYYWLNNEKRMEEEFTALLIQDPKHELDPFYYPAPLLDRFEALRKRLAELKIIDLKKEKTEKKKKCMVPKETVIRRSRAAALIPFGIGQFQNGRVVKGTLFLTGEALALGTNIGTFVAAERLRGSDGAYSPGDAASARKLRVAQYVSLGVFAALVVWDVVDAYLGVKTEERRIDMVPCPEPGVESRGASTPGAADGVSMCLRFR